MSIRERITQSIFVLLVVCLAANPSLAIPPGCAGDYNEDGICADAADFVLFRKFLGTNTILPNDGGLGAPIRHDHYQLWRANFTRYEAGAGGIELSRIATPEPGSLLLCSIGGFAASCLTARRRNRQR
jgi:hypothetical protein